MILLLWLCLAIAAAAERRYAVVVGANRGDADEPRLQFAERDAERVAEVLRTLGGVDPADLVLLKAPDAAGLRAVLLRINQRIRAEAQPGDSQVLLLYYSGHADSSDLHLSGTRFPLVELRRSAANSPARARVLVVDACRSGELTRMKGAAPAAPFKITASTPAVSDGLAIITSAAAGEDAQESDRLQGGVFTHHLLAGLQGAADESGDHRVTLTEAYRYAYAQTLVATSRAPVLQHPVYDFDMTGQDDLVLTELESMRRVGYLHLPKGGDYVIFDPKGTSLVVELAVPDGGRIALPEGGYLLRRRTASAVYQTSIRVTQGQELSVGAAQMEQLAYGQTARRGYGGEPRSAGALVLGGSATSPLLPDLSWSPSGYAGFRLDRPELSLMARGRYARAWADNEFLSIDQVAAGGDVAAFKLWDWRAVAAGGGLRGGAEWTRQRFDTEGQAADRDSFIGHAGLFSRGEVIVGPRLSLGLEVGGAAYWVPVEEPERGERVINKAVLYGGLDLSLFLF